MTTWEILQSAKAAAPALSLADTQTKNSALEHMARQLLLRADEILAANCADVEASRETLGEVMIDRLTLTHERLAGMAAGIRAVAALPDPVGMILERFEHASGLVIEKTAVPMGVVAIIYESRPNVTSDAAALSLKSGNACVLRSGKEAHRSASCIVHALQMGLQEAGLQTELVQLVADTTRESATQLMTAVGLVDLLIPRGGAGLIRSCTEHATVPCIQTGTGICHIYVDEQADLETACEIVENAKTSRPSVCNAAEVCLVHERIAKQFLPMLYDALCERRRAQGLLPVTLRLDEKSAAIISGEPAGSMDYDTEFLDYILAVKTVSGLQEAISHISAHSTGHSDAILTQDADAARRFAALVDSAAVYINASTRFTDGGEFGLGCEMGISTQKLHARGPMGLREMTTYKYIVRGNGQIR